MPQMTAYHSDKIEVLPETICKFFTEEFSFNPNIESEFNELVELTMFARLISHVVNTGQKTGTAWIAPFVEKIAAYCSANSITSWSERLSLLIKSNEMAKCSLPVESLRAKTITTLTDWKEIYNEIDEFENQTWGGNI